MTPEEWKIICEEVTDAMREHTRPVVTPLSTSTEDKVRLVGSGSYVAANGQCLLVTCEHVARMVPMEYRFFGCESVFRYPAPFTMEPHPVDAAFAPISEHAWRQATHRAGAIPYEKFADRHHLAQPEELIFFRGYTGENAHYGFDIHETNGGGYCSQEKKTDRPDPQFFEMFWQPEKTQFASSTSEAEKAQVRFDDPTGYSGSLVWNTRYLEITAAGKSWSPDDARITGLLRRYDPDTASLLVLRVEHLRRWLESHL